MAWDDELDPGGGAYAIAASVADRMRVLAGPGTGKSFAMKRRVARLLEVDRVDPAQILAVTFTRVAADDLHRELVALGVFYVGITRVKANPEAGLSGSLFLTHSLRMPVAMAHRAQISFSQQTYDEAHLQASSFLSELGASAPQPRMG